HPRSPPRSPFFPYTTLFRSHVIILLEIHVGDPHALARDDPPGDRAPQGLLRQLIPAVVGDGGRARFHGSSPHAGLDRGRFQGRIAITPAGKPLPWAGFGNITITRAPYSGTRSRSASISIW